MELVHPYKWPKMNGCNWGGKKPTSRGPISPLCLTIRLAGISQGFVKLRFVFFSQRNLLVFRVVKRCCVCLLNFYLPRKTNPAYKHCLIGREFMGV